MAALAVRSKKARLWLDVPGGYNFLAMCKGYRWVKYPPFRMNISKESLAYVHDLGTTVCRSVTSFNGRRLEVEIESEHLLDPEERNLLIIQLRRIYSLHWNLKSFHKLLSKEKEFSWIAKQRLGWFLRSASFFEDIVKMLLSVNCTREQTQEMTVNLVQELGKPLSAKSPYHAFPTPEMILKAGVNVLRQRIKSGYRSQSIAEAAHRFSKGEFQEGELVNLSTLEVRKRLLTLRGLDSLFLRQLMLFQGRFDDLSTDGMHAPSDGKLLPSLTPRPLLIQAMYRKWGEWQGLVAWFDLDETKNSPEMVGN